MTENDKELIQRSSNCEVATYPNIVGAAGPAAKFAYDEFFHARIRNPFTRKTYRQAVHQFLSWLEGNRIELVRVTPRDVGDYMDSQSYAANTKNVHLAALRHFFDELVLRHVVVLNPVLSVRNERHQVVEGKTPEIGVRSARLLLESISVNHVVGLRDRAVIAVLIYTAARVGAVAKLRRSDFYDVGTQHCLRFTEKSGKSREIPVRHDLQAFIQDYIEAGGLRDISANTPLFRSTVRKTKQLTDRPMQAGDMRRMLKRRLRDAELVTRATPHSFRVTTITDLLDQGVPLEDVQRLAGHSDPRTTRLYDRRSRRITRNIVERISI